MCFRGRYFINKIEYKKILQVEVCNIFNLSGRGVLVDYLLSGKIIISFRTY